MPAVHLSRLFIRNFRSIREIDLRFEPGKNVIVGRNNAGKSNIVRALDLVLGERAPDYAKAENVSEKDFHTWKEDEDGEIVVRAAEEINIWCELQRDEDEALNYEELYKCYGFYIHTEDGGSWRNPAPPRRIDRTLLPEDFDEVFFAEQDRSPKRYIDPKKRDGQPLEAQFDPAYRFAVAFRARRDNHGRIHKEMRFLYREDDTRDWILCFRVPIRTELLQSAIVPSFRDPATQLRLTQWSWYGKLMRHLTSNHPRAADLQEALVGVKSVADEIFAEVQQGIVNSALDVAFPGTNISFQFGAESRVDLYKGTQIYVDDGYNSELTEKGSGIQSATIIGLFNYYTHHVNTTTSALLCVEEPELYLHPHARRVISSRLDDFMAERHQVVLTTHSPEFIRTTADALNVILVRKDGTATTATSIRLQDFRRVVIASDHGELFFADKVILCEGLDAHIIRFIADALYPGKLDEQNISVLAVGGKNQIPEWCKLVVHLGIKCFLLADFDFLLRDGQDARMRYNAQAHKSLGDVHVSFFQQPCTFGISGSKVQSSIAKVRTRLKAADERRFYTAKHIREIADEDLHSGLERMRQGGVCILPGEIEDLFLDRALLENGKVSYATIYRVHRHLRSGTPLGEMFDPEPVRSFLDAVFAR